MNPKASMSMSTSSVESYNQRASQKRLLHSDSSVSYQVNLPSNFNREDSIKEIISRSVALMHDQDLETTTSRSFVHGLILVSIMIGSLIAFISSKVRRCSSYPDLSNYDDCFKYFHFYSVMTIISTFFAFLVYFLHLIAQCDILCLARKKYQFEIMFIATICSLLLLSSVCYAAHTDIFAESFTLASLILSCLVVVLYVLRVIILAYEMVSKRRRRRRQLAVQGSQRSRDLSIITTARRSISQDHNSVLGESALPVSKVNYVSYVKNAQRRTMSTSVSDEDDDVFIK